MDVLSDILNLIKFDACLYYTTRFYDVWGLKVPSFKRVARFHVVLGGGCWIRIDAVNEPIRLESGEMVIIPHGAAHILSNSPDTQFRNLEEVLEESDYEGYGPFVYGSSRTGEQTQLICGHLEYDPRLNHPVMEELPSYITVKGCQAREFGWFNQAVHLMAIEAGESRAGNSIIAKKLSEILFIQALRIHYEDTSRGNGFIAALKDLEIGRSLQAIHHESARKWSLADLAREAGLSRTAFAQRFRCRLGMTPMQYLTNWRIQKAKRMLVEGGDTVEVVAEKVGYDSIAAFSRVFKKLEGIGPGGFRRM